MSLGEPKTLRRPGAIRNVAAMIERDASSVGPQAVPRRDQILIATCILLISAIAWAYLVYLRGQASSVRASSSAIGMAMDSTDGVVGVLLTFTMWAVMMVGMMGPSAAPILLLFAT